MRRALSVAPLAASQRGLSGIMNIPMKNRVAGIAVTPNIQRHPTCPFHEFKISLSVAVGGKGPPVNQFNTLGHKKTINPKSWLLGKTLSPKKAGGNTAASQGRRDGAHTHRTPPRTHPT